MKLSEKTIQILTFVSIVITALLSMNGEKPRIDVKD
jgi:hypothetical protein